MISILREFYQSSLPYESKLRLYKIRHPLKYRKLRTMVYSSPKGDFSLKPFDEHRCIFIHITKTGGTSIAKSLFGYLPYHYSAIDYRVIYGSKLFYSFFKFAFVRNPWDRLYSAYRYLMNGGWNEQDKDWTQNNISQYNNFNSFVRDWLCKENIHRHVHFWPQYRFICDKNDQILVNYLGYFETLKNDYDRISSLLNINNEIGRHNINPGKDYSKAYAADTRDIVARVYSKDIDLFGYDFNGIRIRTMVGGS